MIAPAPPFRLSTADKSTSTWTALRAHYEARLQELRKKNDTEQDEAKTAYLRGRIAEIKALLELDQALLRVED